jgi:hypothetical protein
MRSVVSMLGPRRVTLRNVAPAAEHFICRTGDISRRKIGHAAEPGSPVGPTKRRVPAHTVLAVNDPRRTSMTRIRIALAAAVAALATAAVLAASGSAQTAPTTLHLVSKSQKGVGFFPKGRPHQGDAVGFGDKISGDDSGFDRAACTVVGQGIVCTIQVQLSKGTLSVQGMPPQRAKNTPMAIVGGTGAYNGARGTAFVTDVNDSTTDITVNLLP